jgi:hypothetical protein
VNIYIDEAGSFIPTPRANYVSCVCGLIVPAGKEQFLFDSFLRLRTSWGKRSDEIKGSSLNENQVARVLQLLAKYDVLAEICAIYTSEVSDEGITELKGKQADALTANLGPEHHPNLVASLKEIQERLRSTPNQLYLQNYLLTRLFDTLLRIGTGFWSQRVPSELGQFQWRIDAKDKTITEAEEIWRKLLMPYLQTGSLSDPLPQVDSPEFDYSHLEQLVMDERTEEEQSRRHLEWLRQIKGVPDSQPMSAINMKAPFQDLHFCDSKDSIGLQLADIVASTFHRACKGTLQKDGWRSLGSLFVLRRKDVVNVVAIADDPGVLQEKMSTNKHLTDVLVTLKRGARSMMVS